MKNVYIIDGWGAYERMWQDMGYNVCNSVEEADVVCFTGGEDVNPQFYSHPAHRTTHYNTYRDVKEAALFEQCIILGIPMVGICRGAQFLNVMSGGTMYQDVTNHCRDHLIEDAASPLSIKVSSTHHQMMNPSSEGLLRAFSTHPYMRTYWDGAEFVTEDAEIGIEVVEYKHTKCLCFQPHPEFDGYPGMRQYFTTLVNELVGV